MKCGKVLDTKCEHDPIVRQQTLEAARNKKVPQRDYGSSFEAQRQGKWTSPTGSSPGSHNALPSYHSHNINPQQPYRPVSKSSRGCCTITFRTIVAVSLPSTLNLELWKLMEFTVDIRWSYRSHSVEMCLSPIFRSIYPHETLHTSVQFGYRGSRRPKRFMLPSLWLISVFRCSRCHRHGLLHISCS
jgi:hypothetical protein